MGLTKHFSSVQFVVSRDGCIGSFYEDDIFGFTVLNQERSSFRSDRRLSGTFWDGELQYPVTESIIFYWCKGFYIVHM
jgi:hypothetical protein